MDYGIVGGATPLNRAVSFLFPWLSSLRCQVARTMTLTVGACLLANADGVQRFTSCGKKNLGTPVNVPGRSLDIPFVAWRGKAIENANVGRIY